MRSFGADRAFRASGDEFAVMGDSRERLPGLASPREGPGFCFGRGSEAAEADGDLARRGAEGERSGLRGRARAPRPPWGRSSTSGGLYFFGGPPSHFFVGRSGPGERLPGRLGIYCLPCPGHGPAPPKFSRPSFGRDFLRVQTALDRLLRWRRSRTVRTGSCTSCPTVRLTWPRRSPTGSCD